MDYLSQYRGADIAFPTLHRKGGLAAEAFHKTLGMNVIEIALDTDQFGTFAGEIERTLSPIECARAKIQLGLSTNSFRYAIASEGTIGADPVVPFLNSDIETVVFFDAINNLEIKHTHRSFEIVAASIEYTFTTDLDEFLQKADFPHHRLIVKTINPQVTAIRKGIGDRSELEDAISEAIASGSKKIIIESDLRAHSSPSRAANIKEAFRQLTQMIATTCPDCATPGWAVVDAVKGLPCEDCGETSPEAVKSYIYGCISCPLRKEGDELATSVDPSRCSWCNP